MKNASAMTKVRKLLLVALILVFSLSLCTALADDAWTALNIYVSWNDGNGNDYESIAVPYDENGQQNFWAMVGPEAFTNGVEIFMEHAVHDDWTFTPENGALIQSVPNAVTIDGISMITVEAWENGTPVDRYYLYLSTNDVPQDGSNGEPEVVVTPEPVLPAEADIYVLHVDVNGNTLLQQSVHVTEGSSVDVYAEYFEGYHTVGDTAQTVTIDSDAVTFRYEADPVATEIPLREADVTVLCEATDGTVLSSEYVHMVEGNTQTVYAGSFEGYHIVSAGEAEVTVDSGSVTFWFEADPVATEIPLREADVYIRNVTTDGSILEDYTVHVIEGQPQTVYASSYEGYHRVGNAEAVIDVDSAVVDFYFEADPVATDVPLREEDILVQYITTDGEYLNSTTVHVTEGETIPVYAEAFEGYTLAGDAEQTVTVDTDSVTFYYTAVVTAPAEAQYADVNIRYWTRDGEWLGDEAIRVYENSPETVTAPEMDGYVLISDESVVVTVNSRGESDPAIVDFYYESAAAATEIPEAPVTPAPDAKSAEVTVICQTQDGSRLNTYTVTVVEGQPEAIEAPMFINYEVVGDSVVTVTCDASGKLSTEAVYFTYNETVTVPSSAEVTVHYVNAKKQEIAESQTYTIPNGSWGLEAAPTGLADDWIISSDPNVAVVVTNGVADPAEIYFYYEKLVTPAPTEEPAKNALITVNYTSRDGSVRQKPSTVELEGGKTTEIAPDPSRVPDGYELVDTAPVKVTVTRDGVPSVDSVTFTFRETVVETPIPVGTNVNRFATVNSKQVKVRTGASTKNKTVTTAEKNTVIWVVKEETNAAGETWGQITINGKQGYMMSKYYDVMTQYESDDYEAANCKTPVPAEMRGESTPVPTAEPVIMIADTPTPVPTMVPATEVPVTEVPVTEVPVTEVPVTEVPATKVPVTQAPVTDAPAVETKAAAVAAASADGTKPPRATEVPVVTEIPVITELPSYIEEDVQYTGYALTTRATELRSKPSSNSSTVIDELNANALLIVSGQTYADNGDEWHQVTTLDNKYGVVPSSAVRTINVDEAQYYIDRWNNGMMTAAPTAEPVITPEPAQVSGYAYTQGDGVPFRTLPSSVMSINEYLQANTVVYISSQYYDEDGQAWHYVYYHNQWGYIRADMLRMMNAQQQQSYIDSLSATPEPTPQVTQAPSNLNASSCYGYVSSATVNFREKASTTSARIRVLKRYAFCLILGTEEVNGNTWYKVDYGGTQGYIQGSYFKQLTISELSEFLNSENYREGIANNATASATANTSTANGGTQVVSAENQTYNNWVDNGLNPTYEPFSAFATAEPIATVAPISTLAPDATSPGSGYTKVEGLYSKSAYGYRRIEAGEDITGYQPQNLYYRSGSGYQQVPSTSKIVFDSASSSAWVTGIAVQITATPLPTDAPAALPTAEVIYPTENDKTPTNIWPILIILVLLFTGGGIAYFLTANNRKKQQQSQRAAVKRMQAQRSQQPQQNPYARPQTAGAPAPDQQMRRPAAQSSTAPVRSQQKPQSGQMNPYSRPRTVENTASAQQSYRNTASEYPYAQYSRPATAQPSVSKEEPEERNTYRAENDPVQPQSTAPSTGRRRRSAIYDEDGNNGSL